MNKEFGFLKFVAPTITLFGCSSLNAPQITKPNIIFIVSDDHSAPFLGCYGTTDLRTPNLDKLASEGVLFNRAYVTAPQSAPSRSSFFTGRSPVSTTMSMFSLPLPADAITYPDVLKANGYYIGVAARSHHQDGLKRNKEIAETIIKHDMRTFGRRFDYHKEGGKPLTEFCAFLDTTPNDKPFYVQVSFYDPHRPWDKNAISQPHDPTQIRLPESYPDTPLIREDFARHYDEISRMDAEFGQMMDELKRRGLYENSIIVFVGDNGSALLRGKGTLYETGLNVPLIVKWSGIKDKGSVSNKIISGEDFAPTLIELIGAEQPKEMTGVSFLPILKGEAQSAQREYAFAARGAHAEDLPKTTKDFDLSRAIIGDRYKLIYNATWQLPYWPVDFSYEPFWKEMVDMNTKGALDSKWTALYFTTRPMIELYDLQNDPKELTNLAGVEEYADIEKELRALLAERMLLDRDYVPLPFYSLDKEYR